MNSTTSVGFLITIDMKDNIITLGNLEITKVRHNAVPYRDSVIKYTEWAYGLVIYAGKNCLIYNYNQNLKPNTNLSIMNQKANAFYFFSYLHIILNILVNKLLIIYFILNLFIIFFLN